LTLDEKLKESGERVDPMYLIDLGTTTPTAVNIEYHAAIIRERAIRRLIINESAGLSRDAGAITEELDQLILRINKLAKDIDRPLNRNEEPRIMSDYFDDVIEKTEEAVRRLDQKGVLREIPTGIRDLDNISGGLDRQSLTVLAARPSEGKTALALWILGNVAASVGPCLFFSLEMDASEIASRYLYSRADFPFSSSEVSMERCRDLYKTAKDLRDVELYADPTPRLNIQEICRRAELFAAEHGEPAMICIDYLTLISEPDNTGKRRFSDGNYRLYVQEITRECKLLARNLNCSVLLVAQFNREIERSKDKRKPRMSDIRESGSIEQDADMILLPYRDEEMELHKPGNRKLLIAKNRNGRTGEIQYYFRPDSTRISDADWRGLDAPPAPSSYYEPSNKDDEEAPF